MRFFMRWRWSFFVWWRWWVARSDSAPASNTSSVVSAAATAPPPASASPELLLCQEAPGSRTRQLEALSGGPEGVTVTSLASFSGVSEKTCSVSPDLTKLAEISETSEGSKVAGYLPAGGSSFVNLSGHASNGYSGTTHTDEQPLFDPVTGDLWWTSERHVRSSALNGGKPQDHGSGQVGAFTAAGEPRVYKWSRSPDGSVEVFAKNLEEIHYSQGLGLAIGRSRDVSASCEDRAGKNPSPGGVGAADFIRACPGVARVAFETTCDSFVGLISDSAFICGLTKDGGQRFYRVTFAINGNQVKIVSHVPLTPATMMEIGWTVVSPDGRTLWYLATSGGSTPESTEQTKLYIVSTATPTPEPSPVSLTPETSLATITMTGWRWHGRFLPGG